MIKINKNSGFTLIELLVAVSIFVLLTAVAVVNFQSANRRARDGRRQAELEQLRNALEIYRTDNPGTGYPAGDFIAMVNTLQTGNYLKTDPVEPKGYSYYYWVAADNSNYFLCAYLETPGLGSDACGDYCLAPGDCNYQVDSP